MEAAILLRDSKRFEESKSMFEAILPLVEDRHLPLVGIGTILFENGEFDEAIDRFEEATRHDPECALAHAHLGEALAFARHTEEAEFALQKTIDLDPGGKNGGEMARTIQKFLAMGFL